MAVARAINKVSDLLDKICSVILVAMLAGMVLTTSLQIICRVFFTALSWSEEVTRYLLVWSTFIGAGCVYKKGGHISVTFAQEKLPQKLQKGAQILVHLLCGALFAIAVYYGFKYMDKQGTQLSAALRIPMSLMYMAIPLGCGVMLLHAFNAIIQIFVKKEAAGE
ncbi:TRAP transporter small permease [Lutispora sp.]|uniref:TRAP transporter small permease n=1 Tax=Lutispora sp. TaxID=2828727 RepID=UPI000EC99A87|nr:TRAP transporter small permease [Lutispora sp.]MEA4963012.1 TRAP transporter small permease [Lutispora sp.]HCJ59097.1 TRAP transporter small permease [Clostridiaceae bacterium]